MISLWRSVSSNCTYAGTLRQQLGCNAAAEEAPARSQAQPLAVAPLREPVLLEPLESLLVDGGLEPCESQRFVEPQSEHDSLPALDVVVERFELARRRFSPRERFEVRGEPRRVSSPDPSERRDGTDAEAEIVLAEPVGEVVMRPQVPSVSQFGTPAEVRRLVPPIPG